VVDSAPAWERVALEEFLEPGSLTYGIVQPGQHVDAGVPIVRVKDMEGGRVRTDSPLRVSADIEAGYQRSRIRQGDVLVSLVGSVGTCAIAGPELVGWNLARAVAVVRPKVGVDPRWIVYCLRGPEAQAHIQRVVNTTVQTTLNLRDLKEVPVPLPLPTEQLAIADVLGALDDKIESNRRLQDAAADLLEAEVGAVVHGASKEPMNRTLTVEMGSPFSGDMFSSTGSGRPLIRIRDLKSFAPQTWTTEVREDEKVVDPGDVLVGMDAEFRSTLWLGSRGVLNQRVCRFRPRRGVGRAFALVAIRPELAFYEQAKSGTTVIHLNKADIARFQVPLLDDTAHAQLADRTEPLIDRWVAAAAESTMLAELRDALIPELLSGRLRVPVAEELVESAT